MAPGDPIPKSSSFYTDPRKNFHADPTRYAPAIIEPQRQKSIASVFTPANYAQFALPIAAVIESIATKGQSPGTAAMAQQNMFLSNEEKRQRDAEKKQKLAKDAQVEREVLRQKAIERQLGIEASELDPDSDTFKKDVFKISAQLDPKGTLGKALTGEGKKSVWQLKQDQVSDEDKKGLLSYVDGIPEGEISDRDKMAMQLLIRTDPASAAATIAKGSWGTSEAFRKARGLIKIGVERIRKETPAKAAQSASVSAASTSASEEQKYGSEKGRFDDIMSIRKEFKAETKDFFTSQNGFSKVKNAAKLKTAPGDMALLFGFMKTIDPRSTVREGEYATAEQARGIPARIIGLYNKAIDGQKLTDTDRERFIEAARSGYNAYLDQYKDIVDDYETIIGERGIDPISVLGKKYRVWDEFATPTASEQSGKQKFVWDPATESFIGE